MLFKEFSSLRDLHHKNILKIINFYNLQGEGMGEVAIVLEFCEGGDLK